jgi:site-specific DNA-methyltransferase (adenine-specific)
MSREQRSAEAVHQSGNGWTMYLGDCLEVLEREQPAVGCVVTDPPYSSGARTEASKATRGDGMLRGPRWANRPIDCDQMTTTGFVWLIREVALACEPLLHDGASVLSFIDWRQWPNLVGALESVNLRVNAMVVWDKESFGMGNGFRAQHELVCWATKGVAKPAALDTPNVLRFPREAPEWHPSPKPVPLMEALLRVASKPGEAVLDPFAGGGSTGVACLRTGREFIGIERDPKHFATACDRLRAEENGSTLAASRAGQMPLLGGVK